MSMSSTARDLAACRDIFRWVSRLSVSCRPMESTGLREVIGSWNTIAMRLPRIARISVSLSWRRSSPWNSADPPMTLPGGVGMRRMIERAVTLFPHPLSPTSPMKPPSFRSKLIPSTALMTLSLAKKCVLRSRTERRTPISRSCSSLHQLGLRLREGGVLRRLHQWNRACPVPLSRGSRRSRIASPSMLNPHTTSISAKPGAKASHGACCK